MEQQVILETSDNGRMGLSDETVDLFSRARAEPAWAREARLRAWEAYKEAPWLSHEDETWRRTDLSTLDLKSVILSVTPPAAATEPGALPPDLQALLQGDAEEGTLIQKDTEVIYHRLSDDLSRKGVIFTSLETAVREHPGLVQPYLEAQGTPTDGRFEALHRSLWSGGVFLYVPRGVQVALPLRGCFWMTPSPGAAIFPYTLIVAEPESQVLYIDEYASPPQEGQALSIGVVNLFLKRGARVGYFNVQRWGGGVVHLLNQRASADQDSQLTAVSVALGAQLTKANIEALLQGPGAVAQLLGITFGDGGQHFDYHTLQDHLAPNTTSDLLFKTALKDRARSVYMGLIHVHKKAQHSDAYQANRNLLLSRQAEADTLPKLEIEAHEVRCTHGATVGPVNEDQEYYLMTRGLSRDEADRMIVEGFFDQVLQRIPGEAMRERLSAYIGRKLRVGE